MSQAERNSNTKRKYALYSRLSAEDSLNGESMSISSQKAILEEFAYSHGYIPFIHYSDDGYSGTNFNRPGFQKMIEGIEHGDICCVITKDLSRLGSNYIESGLYIEDFFPRHKVEYISVNDGVNSALNSGMEIIPFKNILNEYVSRDISKKVKTGKDIRSRQGKFMGTTAPFGLMKDPQDKNHLIIDPQTAPTVRMLFELALQGMGNNRIRKILYEKKILKPACYKMEQFGRYIITEDDPYDWKRETVCRILRNPVYKGGMWVRCNSKTNFRAKTKGYIPQKEREVLEDIHEAIVTKEDWQTVQEIMDRHTRVRASSSKYENIFRGMLRCPDCGAVLLMHTDNRPFAREKDPLERTDYSCSTYRIYGKGKCTKHRIDAKPLEKAVLRDIRAHARLAVKDKEAFVRSILSSMDANAAQELQEMEKELSERKAEAQELDQQFIRLYDDLSKGVLTEKRFQMLTAHYEEQQEKCEQRVKELEALMAAKKQDSGKAEQFVKEVSQYANIKELTGEVLNRLIEKIVVYEPTEVKGVLRQKIEIHYRFVGAIGNNRKKTV